MRDQDKTVRLSADLRQELAHHSWPGNVRQLRNVVNRLVSIANDGQTLVRLPFDPRSLAR